MPIGPTELIVVLALALLILGPKRLPSAGRSLGRGMREFKDGIAMTPAEFKDGAANATDDPADQRAVESRPA